MCWLSATSGGGRQQMHAITQRGSAATSGPMPPYASPDRLRASCSSCLPTPSPLLDQAVPKNLAPLPLDEVGEYVAGRFEKTGRDVGDALTPMLEFTRGRKKEKKTRSGA